MEVRIPIRDYMMTSRYSHELISPIEEWFVRNRFKEGRDWWFDFDFNKLADGNALYFSERRTAQLFFLAWCTFPL